VPFDEREGLTDSMADIPEGAPEDAMDLVREFY
jgi:2-oxoglutarate ferredoxin oxidoreductase subunit beta